MEALTRSEQCELRQAPRQHGRLTGKQHPIALLGRFRRRFSGRRLSVFSRCTDIHGTNCLVGHGSAVLASGHHWPGSLKRQPDHEQNRKQASKPGDHGIKRLVIVRSSIPASFHSARTTSTAAAATRRQHHGSFTSEYEPSHCRTVERCGEKLLPWRSQI